MKIFTFKTLLLSLALSAFAINANASYTFHKSVRNLTVIGTTTDTSPSTPPATNETITLSNGWDGYLPTGTANSVYSFNMRQLASISGSTNKVSDLIWGLSSGSLPSGMSLTGAGMITGTPLVEDMKTFQVSANSNLSSAQQTYTLIVNGSSSISVKQLAPGLNHTCAIMADDTVSCWGDNTQGQLGNGTYTASTSPVAVTGLSGIKNIKSGNYFTCAQTTDDMLYCWGGNGSGQLGDGSTTNRAIPVLTKQLTAGIKQFSLGMDHACAVDKANSTKCWGGGMYGKLGNADTVNKSTPVTISTSFSKIFAGAYHSCGILTSGAIRCWGLTNYGQLGDGNTSGYNLSYRTVTGISSGTTDMALGHLHTCAIVYGSVKCWGYNATGQLGVGSTTTKATPYDVAGTSNIISLTAGVDHTCGAFANNVMKCWGSNVYGQIGNNGAGASLTPSTVVGFTVPATAIYTGTYSYHTCAVTASGAAKCWGKNTNSQVGDKTTTNQPIPVYVSP